MCVSKLRQSVTFAPVLQATANGLHRGALALRASNPRENLEALKTERYYDWMSHEYKYRIPGTTDNLNGRMEYVNYS